MTVAYVVELAEPQAHIYRVSVTVPTPMEHEQLFSLPNWVPGSYKIRDMAGHVVHVKALDDETELPIVKLDKSTWRVSTRSLKGPLTLIYEVYAADPSVRLAYLDTQRAFFNPSSLLLCPLGFEKEPVTLDLINHDSSEYCHWSVATGMTRAKGTGNGEFGRYYAADYEALIDCPFAVGELKRLSFKLYGTRHEIVLSGHIPLFDEDRLVRDVKSACQKVIDLFDPTTHRAPFEHYVFLLHLTANQYGGLEHANSTALVASWHDLPCESTTIDDQGYQSLLTLMTHEYFHAWWVKRVKPAMFTPYDLTRECCSQLLWVFEGFTSYYDEKLVHEAGLTGDDAYCRALSERFTHHLSNTARYRQTLAESSFDAWIKYYCPDGNRPNAVVNYYIKGALVAMAIDAEIRRKTRREKSLDDVLRYAYTQWLETGNDYAGIDEDFMSELVWEATGVDLTQLIQTWTQSTQEPDYEKTLQAFGLTMSREKLPVLRSRLGVSVREEAAELVVTQVYDGSSAQAAGLMQGDRLVAIDNVRVRVGQLDKLLKRLSVDQVVSLYVFRDDILMPMVLTVGDDCDGKVVIAKKKRTRARA